MGEYPRIESQKGREQQRWAAGTPTEMAGALGGPGGFSLVELKKMEAAVGFYDGDGDSDGSMSMAISSISGDEPTVEPTAQSTTTVFVKLPAEIKNRIYDLMLVTPGEPVYIKQSENRRRRGKKLKTPTSKRTSWQEPALLRVNKEVRAETLPQYYGSNAFVIPLFMEDMGDAAAWLESIMKATGTCTSFLSLSIVVHGDAWILLERLRPMVSLMRTYGTDFARAEGKEATIKDAGVPRAPTFEMSRNTGHHINAVFTAIIDLGESAHDEGWTEAYLDMEFTKLVEELEETPGGRAATGKLIRWNRNIRKLERAERWKILSQQGKVDASRRLPRDLQPLWSALGIVTGWLSF